MKQQQLKGQEEEQQQKQQQNQHKCQIFDINSQTNSTIINTNLPDITIQRDMRKISCEKKKEQENKIACHDWATDQHFQVYTTYQPDTQKQMETFCHASHGSPKPRTQDNCNIEECLHQLESEREQLNSKTIHLFKRFHTFELEKMIERWEKIKQQQDNTMARWATSIEIMKKKPAEHLGSPIL